MKLSQKRVLSLELPVTSLIFRLSVKAAPGFFGIGSKPAVIKVRRIEPVSDMQEIDELVESVKLDAIKEEKKLEKPFTPDVKKESAPKAAPAEEKKPVKKEAVQVEKASEEAPAKAAAQGKTCKGFPKAKQSLHVRNSQELQRSVSRRKHVRELRSRADR